jgi:copper(I)-binding protein
MRSLLTPCIALFVVSCGAPQDQPRAEAHSESLTIESAWAAPTPAGVDVSAGYLTITNQTATNDRLLFATSPRAERVEIHEMTMDGTVMQMRPIDTLVAPAGESVSLGPGGAHLMFYGVTQPFVSDENIPVELTFEMAGVIAVDIPVRPSAPENHAGH